MTIVLYYRCRREDCDYRGTAYNIHFMPFSANRVVLAHSSHSPPEDSEADEDSAEESDIEPAPQPAIGIRLMPHLISFFILINLR